jgi:hypothetical protein
MPPLLCGQAKAPLTLDQVRKLVTVGAPDDTVAHEIETRGIAFVPSRDLLAQLQGQRAGSKTLAALHDFLPMLDEARKEIPALLKTIYGALDEGNSNSIRPSLSNELANNSSKLDQICKPFTYNAHYLEGIIERPQRRFEVRVRVLFKPLEERAYLLWFGVAGDNFQLQDVSEPSADWTQPQLSAGEQLVRKFVYAVNAGRNDVAEQIVAPRLVGSLPSSKTITAIRNSKISQISTQVLAMFEYKGLKIRNEIWVHEEGKMCCSTYEFLVEPSGDAKIVAWNIGSAKSFESEDAALEYATLKRFGLPATPPPESTAVASSAPPAAGTSTSPVQQQQPEPMRFNVRHRHKPGFIVSGPEAASISFCGGVLTIDKGTVQYFCNQPDTGKNRCERVTFTDIKEVKYQENGLRIVTRSGSWDFFFPDQGQLVAAHEAVAAVLSSPGK